MNCVDLFCGCGGMSLGFMEAGFNVLCGFDNWDKAINAYQKNFSHPCVEIDLSDIRSASDEIKKFNPDMIIGGPPCQDFSLAGKMNEDGGRGLLTISYTGIIGMTRPEWFVMENVPHITTTHKLSVIKEMFHEFGYGLTQVILNACKCGVPQRRKRFFLIGKIGEKDGFMDQCINENLSVHEMTVKEALGDKIGTEYYYRHPRNYKRRAIFSVNEPSPVIRGTNSPMPKSYQLKPGDATNDISKVRPLTTYERMLIQTFPDNFCLEGKKTHIEQMLGNAVPVKLAKYVGDSISRYIHLK